jgi:hypothetical protein
VSDQMRLCERIEEPMSALNIILLRVKNINEEKITKQNVRLKQSHMRAKKKLTSNN